MSGVWSNGLEEVDARGAVLVVDDAVKGKAGGRSGLTSFLIGVEGFGGLGGPKRCCSDESAAPRLGVPTLFVLLLELAAAGGLNAGNLGPPPSVGEAVATARGLGVVGASFIRNDGAAVAETLIMDLGFFFSGDAASNDGVIHLF